jgi:Zn-finger nucleic acid-binding protein
MRLKADMESFQCDYCQRVVLAEKKEDGVRVLNESAGQDCPVCSTPLVRAALAKVPIVYCTGCRGMLIPMQALEALADELRTGQGSEAVPVVPGKDELQRKINCPQCHHVMDAHYYAGPGNVVIDSCEDCCLIWLDSGELMRIARATNDSPFSSESSPAESYAPEQSPDWNHLERRIAGDIVVDGIADLFFR